MFTIADFWRRICRSRWSLIYGAINVQPLIMYSVFPASYEPVSLSVPDKDAP